MIEKREEKIRERGGNGGRERAIIIRARCSIFFSPLIINAGEKGEQSGVRGTSLESQLGADFFSVGRRVFLLSYLFRLVNVVTEL